MAHPNEKVRNCIPTDLMFSIMSKLPPKSLHRFKCVRKSWALIFENSYFMNMYRKSFISNNSYNNDKCLLLKQTDLLNSEKHSSLYLFCSESFDNKVKLVWPPPFEEDDRDINILGSEIYGNLCLYANNDNSKVVVWNPSFKEFKVIPPNRYVSLPPHVRVESQLHGFGYDYNDNDYKLIRYVEFYPDLHCLVNAQLNRLLSMSISKMLYRRPVWEIYSLKSRSWKTLDLDMPSYNKSRRCYLEQVYTKGICHWLCVRENIDDSHLVSFHLDNEMFCLTSIPSLMEKSEAIHLMLLNESIALISKDAKTTTFHISILGEIGVKNSWMKLFIVESLPCLGHPIGVGKNFNIFFSKEDEELAMCDLSTHTVQVQELGIKGAFDSQIVTYKKSLLSILE